ncbi:copper chaperone PCu(A)C [Chitinimonas sp. BJYL2]|uniref:copper chaperone PCu(A)C n=1 Tax=Chitinimonas sp. BJYL2 TaxID=2976696 RepID=UPI0022B3135F|nr:copper chaperone PCu(A)C [Chitinimonas sp. BJYL2]
MTRLIAALLFAATLAPALAHEFKAGSLTIHHPWARATPPGAPVAGAFLKINNTGVADALIGVEAPTLAGMAELHTMSHEGGVMKMRQLDRIAIPAKGSATLKPGSDHIMLMGLKQPLKEGDKLPLTLKFEKAGSVKVEIKVESMTVDPASLHAGH